MPIGGVKQFKVRFYEVQVQQPEETPPYSAQMLFRDLKARARGHNGLCPAFEASGQGYEIRELRAHNQGAVYTGIFAVLRDDAPHIRRGNGDETEINLGQDEGVLEKNHFIFHSAQGVLVYQVNQRANHPRRLEDYLTHLAGLGNGVVLADILTRDAWKQLQRGHVKKVQVVVSKPRNADQYDPEDFAAATLRTMERAGATRVEVNLSVSGPSRGLSGWVRSGILGFRHRSDVKALRVQLDGDDNMLDLLANTVRDTIEVPMNGRYPNTRATHEELERAKDRQQESLDEHFGT